MPKIALLICFIFIIYLYRTDVRRSTQVTGALWIPLIWMMILGSRMVSQWFYTGTADYGVEAFEEGNPVDKYIFSILYILAAIILISRRVTISKFIIQNPWIFIFMLYGGISIVWSDFPVVALKRYFKYLGSILMVLVIVSEPVPFESIKTLIRRCAYALIPLSIVLYKYFPLLGRTYHRWTGSLNITGVTLGKNQIGVLCLVCGFVLFVSLFQKWQETHSLKNMDSMNDIIIFGMIIWLLIQSNSSTALGCFIFGVTIYVMLGLSAIRRKLKYIGIFSIIGFFMLVILQNVLDIFGIITTSLNRDVTLTGRTELWNYLINTGTNPLIGVGFESFWLGRRMEALWDMYWWHPTQAHNGFLEIYLNLGIIGVLLLIAIIISGYKAKKIYYEKEFEYGRFAMTLLAMVVIYNVTEAAFVTGHLMNPIFLTVAINYDKT